MLPLYEAKMVHHYNHRYSDYRDLPAGSKSAQLPDVPLERLQDPDYQPLPRYWVPRAEVDARLRKATRSGSVEWEWTHDWLLGWRDICRSTDERTVIADVIPRVGVGHKFLLMHSDAECAHGAPGILACLTSYVLDFAARQKIGGTSMGFFVYRQLPVLAPQRLEHAAPWNTGTTVGQWLGSRVIELVCTSPSVASFAAVLGGEPRVFGFDPERREILRAELDAALFLLYGLDRDDAAYILDTFPIVRKEDETRHGRFVTKERILEEMSRLDANASGRTGPETESRRPTTND
jgi:hypothetical protein